MKSKGLFEWKLVSLHGASISKIKRFKHKIGIQLNNNPLVIDQNNLTSKTVNYYIVYDFDNWPKTSLINFALKMLLFDVTDIVKIAIKVSISITAME